MLMPSCVKHSCTSSSNLSTAAGLPAMIDGNIVTGRVPDDVPEFVDAITEALSGTHLLYAAAPASKEVAPTAP